MSAAIERVLSPSPGVDARRLRAAVDRFARGIARGRFPGAQLSLRHRGIEIARAWGGVARGLREGEEGGFDVGPDTRFPCFSAGKPVVAFALALLEARGRLGVQDLVARRAPALDGAAWRGVTILDVLTHRSGILLPELCATPAAWSDPDRVRAALAGARPVHPRGTLAYAPLEYGWILGEVVERVDGRPFARFVAEEIAAPAGLADFGFGADEALRRRSARSYWLGRRAVTVAGRDVGRDFEAVNDSALLHGASVPGAGLVASAAALARFYDLLLPASRAARPGLLDDATLARWTRRESTGWDRSNRAPLAVGRGLLFGTLGPSVYGLLDARSVFGHAGAFCALGFADPARALSGAIVTNGNHGRRELLAHFAPLVAAARRAVARAGPP